VTDFSGGYISFREENKKKITDLLGLIKEWSSKEGKEDLPCLLM
jgi:hypothetical protein